MNTNWKHVAVVRHIYRYPVKGMRGEALQEAEIYWHGVEGDRRYAFSNADDTRSGFPWLTGRKQAQMIQYVPVGQAEEGDIQVRTPAGDLFDIDSEPLAAEITALYEHPARLIRVSRGNFDSMPLSLISTATIANLCGAVGVEPDPRRFRPNLVIELLEGDAFAEESWLGRHASIGDPNAASSVRIRIDRQNQRCRMINLDPDTAESESAMLKHVTQTRDALAGLYASCEQPGSIRVGDGLYIEEGEA